MSRPSFSVSSDIVVTCTLNPRARTLGKALHYKAFPRLRPPQPEKDGNRDKTAGFPPVRRLRCQSSHTLTGAPSPADVTVRHLSYPLAQRGSFPLVQDLEFGS